MVRKYTSLYKDDPIAEELAAGIRGTDVYQGSPYMLSNVPEFEGMKTAATDYNRIRDLYSLYGGGLDAAQDDFATPGPAAPIGGGGGGGGTGTTTGGTGGVNTPEQQRLIDAGIGLQVAPGQPVFAPGEEPVTQADIAAFNQIPVNTDYRNQQLVNQGIGTRVGDKGPVFAPGEEPVTQYEIDQYNLTPGSRVTPIDPTQMIPQISTYTPEQTIAGDVYAGGDYSDVARTLGDPNEKLDFKGAEDAAKKFGFDVNSAAVKMIINTAVGGPVTYLLEALRGLLPKMDPRQKALREFYNIDDIGRVAEGELMAGYNPVYGGFPGISEPTYGLQDAYQKRIDTITKTLEKQGDSPSQELTERLAELKEAKEKEKARLDLFSGDIDERDQMLEELMQQEKNQIKMTDPSLKIPDRGRGDTDELGRTYQDEKTALPIWIPEKEEQDLQEELALEKELADQRDDFRTQGEEYMVVTKTGDVGTTTLANMSMTEFSELLKDNPNNSIALIQGRTRGQEYLDDLEEIGKDADYIGYTDEEKAAMAAGEMEPQLGDLITYGIDSGMAEAIKREKARIAEVTKQNEIRRQAEIDRLRRQAAQGQGGGQGDRSGGRSSSSGESDYGGFCFDPNTLVQMADGSEKKIKEIQLGDNTKGGEVTGVFQFKAADEIHDYKGVTVAGSHYVKEDGKFIMVQDSPISVKIDKIPVVYSLDTAGRRIFINGIEFADYNGDGIAKGFLHNAGLELNGFNKEVLRQVENRLI